MVDCSVFGPREYMVMICSAYYKCSHMTKITLQLFGHRAHGEVIIGCCVWQNVNAARLTHIKAPAIGARSGTEQVARAPYSIMYAEAKMKYKMWDSQSIGLRRGTLVSIPRAQYVLTSSSSSSSLSGYRAVLVKWAWFPI